MVPLAHWMLRSCCFALIASVIKACQSLVHGGITYLSQQRDQSACEVSKYISNTDFLTQRSNLLNDLLC